LSIKVEGRIGQGIKITIDFVPNHVGFRAAMHSHMVNGGVLREFDMSQF
jgi:hypothetical protein